MVVEWAKPPNETVEKPLVLRMFKKTSHNRLKNSQSIVKMLFRTPKIGCFSVFLSHFQKIIFGRRLIRQFSFNGLRKPRVLSAGYLQAGGCGLCLGAEKTRSQKNAPN